jgi:hypothetical protein
MPYRRYSDAFAVPPYPGDSYNGEQQENQPRQGNHGRGMRSYSMEYGNYPSTRQVRSQSMEGPQGFASAPPMEYPPSLSRSNSAGVAFDWSRGRMEPAPPLPPDVRPGSGNGAHYPQPPPEAYYDVEFKRGRQEVFAGRAAYKPGEFVKVCCLAFFIVTCIGAHIQMAALALGGGRSRGGYWSYRAAHH